MIDKTVLAKWHFPLIILQNILNFGHSLGDHDDVFLRILFVHRWFCPWNMDVIFTRPLSYSWIMKTDCSWRKGQLLPMLFWVFCDVVGKWLMLTFSNLCRATTSEKVQRCSMFSTLVDNGLTVVHCSSKASEMALQTLVDRKWSVTLFLICF